MDSDIYIILYYITKRYFDVPTGIMFMLLLIIYIHINSYDDKRVNRSNRLNDREPIYIYIIPDTLLLRHPASKMFTILYSIAHIIY